MPPQFFFPIREAELAVTLSPLHEEVVGDFRLALWVLAFWGIPLLLALSPASLPRTAEVGVDFRALGLTLALSLLAGVIFGLAPAWQATRVSLNEELKESGRSSAGGRGRFARGA